MSLGAGGREENRAPSFLPSLSRQEEPASMQLPLDKVAKLTAAFCPELRSIW